MRFQMRPPSDMPSKTISDFTVKSVHKADMTVERLWKSETLP